MESGLNDLNGGEDELNKLHLSRLKIHQLAKMQIPSLTLQHIKIFSFYLFSGGQFVFLWLRDFD